VIWVGWRQFRSHAFVAAIALAVVAGLLLVTGVHLDHLYTTYKIEHASCRSSCDLLRSQFLDNYRHVKLLGSVLLGVPAVIGIFWGAPLIARELENGTFRLAWTQGVSRRRWLATKLGLVGLASAAAAGLYSLAITWWASPLDHVTNDRIGTGLFSQRGIVPIGYALFAFALGVTAGIVFKRAIPAMAATLVGFIAARALTEFLLRPHLMPAKHASFALSASKGIGVNMANNGQLSIVTDGSSIPGAWTLGSKIVDSSGHPPTAAFVLHACPGLGQPPPNPPAGGHAIRILAPPGASAHFNACIQAVGTKYHEVVTYQPASRFWALQGLETAVFLALTLLLIAGSFFLIRRRVS
jgi:hypothetical protein